MSASPPTVEPHHRRTRAALPALVVAAVLVGLAFDNGGYSSRAWATASVAFLWLAALVLLLIDDVELSALEWIWLGLLAAFLLWSGLSLAWSVNHSEPLLEVRRGLVYVGGAGALLLVAVRRSLFAVLAGVWAATAVVACYAHVRYLLTPGPPDPFQLNLLFRPVGYANGLGILAGIGLVLAITLAVRAPRRISTLCAASTAPLAATISLTSSRASVLAALAGLAAALLAERERLRLVVLVAVCAPLLVIVVDLCERSGLTDDVRSPGADHRARLLALFIALLAVALAFAPALSERAAVRVAPLWTRRSFRRLAAIAIVLVVIVGIVAGAGRVHRFFATGARPAYWRVAWTEYSEHPVLGSGAGTFADYWVRDGNSALYGGALDAHSLYLETLAEVGPMGLVLLVAALAGPLLAAARVRANPVVAVALGGYVTFLSHAALDWDWEMPVVTLAALACGAVLLVAAREGRTVVRPSPGTRMLLIVGAVALAVFALVGELASGLGGTFG